MEVISLSKKKEEIEDLAAANALIPGVKEPPVETDFEAEMKANQARKEKLAKERLVANKSVLRSYRIKN